MANADNKISSNHSDLTWEAMQKAADYQPLNLDEGCIVDIILGTEVVFERLIAAALKEAPNEVDAEKTQLFGLPYESFKTLQEVHERAVELRLHGKKIMVLGE